MVAEGEPEWLPEDRDAALVYQIEQRRKCPRCGTWDWEWDDDPHAWEADLWRCHGCEAIDGQHRRLSEDKITRHDGKQVRLFRPESD